MRVLIVDDEPLARDRLRALIGDVSDVEIVGQAENGAEALSLTRRTAPDVLLLDIQMPRLSGFDVVERLGSDVPPVVIFTTAHSEHAAAAFDVSATDYLVKPFDKARVWRALERARRRLAGTDRERTDSGVPVNRRRQERFAVRTRGAIVFVSASDVLWIGAEGNYVRLYTESASYLLRESMNHLEEILDPDMFLRVHRSAFVKAASIERIAENAIFLFNGARVPLGPNYRRRLRSFIHS
jgi:two-component system, LytTR family, response regulator